MSASVDERMALSQLGNAGWYRRPTDNFVHPMSYSGKPSTTSAIFWF